jgi:hypothetical protein
MITTSSENFYLFKGNGYEKFVELNDVIDIGTPQQIAVWTPKDKSKKHNLIVVNGHELPQRYCFDKNIWKTDQNVFESFYKLKINDYNILSE